jgi:hypothetical protein
MLLAGARFAAIMACLGMHYVYGRALHGIIPAEWALAIKIADGIGFLAFLLISVRQAWELVEMFIPITEIWKLWKNR